MAEARGIPEAQTIGAFTPLREPTRPQAYYDSIKQKFAQERDLRLNYRPEGTAQYTSDLTGMLAKYEIDPHGGELTPRAPITDTVECLFIGGGFSALLTSAWLREYGVESIRIVERGAEEWWVQEVIKQRGKTSRNQDCTPGYYNFEGEVNRRQDGNYNGGFLQYYMHMKEAGEKVSAQFVFTKK